LAPVYTALLEGVMGLTPEPMLINDAGAFAEVFDGRLRGEQQPEHIDVELPVERFFGDCLEGGELVHAGVID